MTKFRRLTRATVEVPTTFSEVSQLWDLSTCLNPRPVWFGDKHTAIGDEKSRGL